MKEPLLRENTMTHVNLDCRSDDGARVHRFLIEVLIDEYLNIIDEHLNIIDGHSNESKISIELNR